MLIPVFVSMPNTLSNKQDAAQRLVLRELGHHGIEARTLGQTDYPTSFPLREVLTLAKHCSGGLILGFSPRHVGAPRRLMCPSCRTVP